jgi:ribosome maturation factor RimP
MAVKLDQIYGLVREVADAGGYELVEVELRGSGRHRVLRIFIDKESGISHDDCERVSRQVGTVLDVEDLVPFSYTLEVSSPGLNRKLSRPEDFRRFQGRLVKIRTTLAIGNQRVFRGRLGGLDDEKIQLAVDADQNIEIPLEAVREARLEVDWDSVLHAQSKR